MYTINFIVRHITEKGQPTALHTEQKYKNATSNNFTVQGNQAI
jgi:hypothetical protein